MKSIKNKKNERLSSGQTLIETMVAAFILTMGITAAVGLAIYAFGTATNVTKQIIATGLSREGVEAIKNMRDTNWLKQTIIDSDCYNYSTGGSDAACYKNWLNQEYCIDPANNVGNSCSGGASGQTFSLSFDSSNPDFWILTRQSGTINYGLNFSSAPGTQGFYYASGSVQGNSIYHRKITLNSITSQPFNNNIGPKLLVISQVWWSDKKCPNSTDWPGLGKCSVEIQTYLTNWKNY